MAPKKPTVQLRKPPSVPQNADAFVKAADAQTPKPLDVQVAKLPAIQTPKLAVAQTPKRPSAQTANHLAIQTVEPPNVQEAKRSDVQESHKAPKEIQERLLAPEAFKPSSAQTSRRPVLRRQDGRELRKMTIYLTPDVAKSLAVRSAQSGLDMSEIVNSALEEWLAR